MVKPRIFFSDFLEKIYYFMQFEKRNGFQNAYNYIFAEKIYVWLPFLVTRNTLIFLLGLGIQFSRKRIQVKPLQNPTELLCGDGEVAIAPGMVA